MPEKTLPLAVTGTSATDPQRGANVIGPNPLDRDADDTNLKAPARRLYYNGSSYSGADIKILVHKYHPGPAQILADIDKAIQIYSAITSDLDQLALAVYQIPLLAADFKSGILSQSEYDTALKTLYFFPIERIELGENLVKSTGYFQHVARALRQKFVAAQQQGSNGQVITEIGRMKILLEDMVEGWRQEKNALDTMSTGGKFIQTKVLAECQTLSVSTFRSKSPARALGHSNPVGWVRGGRTIGGSMIFTVFDRNVLWELLDFDPSDFDGDNKFKAAILDQLPPLDITIQFANEYGSLSRMTVYGVEFLSESQTMSIEDIFLENAVQYIARDVDPMTPVLTEDGRPFSEALVAYNQAIAKGRRPERPLRASDLIGSEWGATSEEEDSAENRFKNRYNPFF